MVNKIFSEFVIEPANIDYKQNLISKNDKQFDKSKFDYLLQTRNIKKLKKLIRTSDWSILDPLRVELWLSLCQMHTSNKRINVIHLYSELKKEIFDEESGDSISTSMLPSFIDKEYIFKRFLSNDGINTAYKIICVVNHERPDIVYCPLLLPLIILFLHYHNEPNTFECASCVVLTRNVVDRMVTQTRSAHYAGAMVLKELTMKYAKKSYQMLSQCTDNLDEIFFDWLKIIFRDLPFVYIVRIMDCYLCEGPKILYRIAIAIFILFKKYRVKSSPKQMEGNSKDVLNEIVNFCNNIPVSIEVLLKTAFGIRGFSRKTLSHHITLVEQNSINKFESHVSGGILQNMGKGAEGEIVQEIMWRYIYNWLPNRQRLKKPKLLFSTSEHGTSLNTFYTKIEGFEPTIVLIKTSNKEIIGGYVSSDWAERKGNQKSVQFFGTGECFIFSLTPSPKYYPWVGLGQTESPPPSANLFAMGDLTQFSIGGGKGIGIMLDAELLKGSSSNCDTFGNPPLIDEETFQANVVEVFTLV